ncbi:conserved hypothetical protein [Nostocoides japonicum T1-X7]|uniref:Uncharacterized protein n=1 Tax=Nostocoides japonicum T1-X7 TaxID=1194083 RepID=A0A077LXW3_9MICO|nr:hypothetical protein [Tetrasphaera japonica]CCH78743.1 conserved hypothetical protein [Tetrasphaera japonica T1-X7]
MPFWRRRGKGGASATTSTRADRSSVETYLRDFVDTRLFVEAYVEPSTNVTSTTVVLIAHDGEWTRRAVESREQAFELAKKLDIPVYDVNQTGYPARMREWTARQRREGRG